MENISRECLESTVLYCCYYLNCNNTYTTKFNLRHHIESIHLKVKKFECEICKKNLSSRQNLREHMNIHNDVKPFVCNHCGKAYRQTSQLTLHKRVHIKDGNNIAVEAAENAHVQIPQPIIKDFEKICWEELQKNQPQLPVIQSSQDQEINLPAFNSVLKKCKKGFYI
ncbi:unnamed protein product [Blepharisma stoltei]|uniref:C2H2-type domain-containing protein n=1 Tax=Blepharisma stoltei TaxID=1481888 RepID=A0AAU9JFA7_9CILI|nr:unnamed protein product [Blepharisma stoltei]